MRYRFFSAAYLVASAFQLQAATPAKPTADMQVVLDQFKQIMGTPIYDLKPTDARQQFSAQDAAKIVARSKHLQDAPEPVGNVLDRTIPGPGGALPIRIYTPAGTGPFPVMVYYHGGGFVIATIDTYDASARALTNLTQAVVVSVEYRKAPEFPFPAAVDDAVTSYKWALRNTHILNGIPGKIAVAGESAGGNLAAVVCLYARDHRLEMPVYQLLVYPVVNDDLNTPSVITYANAIPLNKPALEWFAMYYDSKPADHKDPYAFPLKESNLAGLPPATIIAAEIDPLQSEGMYYADALKGAGVAVNYRFYPGVTHEFFGMGAVIAEAKEAEKDAASDLVKALK